MTNRIETLDCANCEFATLGNAEQAATMCSTVALRTMRELRRMAYDFSSDSKRPSEIVTGLLTTKAVVEIADSECALKLLSHESTRLGYGTLTD